MNYLKHLKQILSVCTGLFVFGISIFGQNANIQPVTPNASPEAKALLAYIQGLSGKHTLTGQHNYPQSGDRNTQFAADYIGKTPVVWSDDFGFSKVGDKDTYLARPEIIKEAIRQYRLGSIVTLCWHAVPPTADEPVTFQPLPGANPEMLASVQGQLTDAQFKDLLTKGTALNKHWMQQVDVIAAYLKQLQDAHVPILWRPYHEMNGGWFWWGGRFKGEYTTAALYRQIYDRLVNFHKLNNLIWVWSVDRPTEPVKAFTNYYPGNQYLDILALDVYGSDFKQAYYDSLMVLSKGKPITLAEVGNPPTLDILKQQPNWTWWVIWAGFVRSTPREQFKTYVKDSRMLFMEDAAYAKGIENIRKVSGFAPLVISRPADFTGEWVLNEYESTIGTNELANTPYKLSIIQKENELTIASVSKVEWADDEVTKQILALDGTENKSTVFNNSPRIQVASWSSGKDTLTIDSKVTTNFGGNSRERKSKEVWSFQRRGKQLVIARTADSFRGGSSSSSMVYDRK
jgi:mannan endo-1,4-beta-mannosidase